MSPSAKKSASGKKSPAASSAKGAAAKKSAAQGDKRKSPPKSAPKKKRSRKKKSARASLWVAFAAGILIAAAASWFLRDLRLPETHLTDSGQIRRVESSSASSASKPPARAAKDSPSKNESAASKGAPSGPANTGKGKADTGSTGKEASRAAQKAEAPRSSPPASPPDADAATSSAVASALIDLQSLPYEESLHAPLDDRIRQVDYALMQAAWMRKLPASSLRLLSVEDRLEGVEPYQFQVIELLPGREARAFQSALKECLAAWAEGASLVESGQNHWSVLLDGVHTHTIRVYPGKSDFPATPSSPGGGAGETAVPREKIPGPDRSLVQPRLRGSGEAPRLVIVIDDLGANQAALKQLLALDYPVTMAFWPHGAHTREGARAAHARGREVIVHQPMEPLGYPKVRPGPNVLLCGMDEARIRKILLESIAAVPYAVGLNNHMGSRFTQDRRGMEAVTRLLRERGLFMLDSVTHSRSLFAAEGRRLGMEHYRRNVFLDVEHSRAAVLAALGRAERIARLSGQAVAIGHPLPETLAALKEWQSRRGKDVRIVRLRDLKQE